MGDKIKCLLLSILYVDFRKNLSSAHVHYCWEFLHFDIDLSVTIEQIY